MDFEKEMTTTLCTVMQSIQKFYAQQHFSFGRFSLSRIYFRIELNSVKMLRSHVLLRCLLRECTNLSFSCYNGDNGDSLDVKIFKVRVMGLVIYSLRQDWILSIDCSLIDTMSTTKTLNY